MGESEKETDRDRKKVRETDIQTSIERCVGTNIKIHMHKRANIHENM